MPAFLPEGDAVQSQDNEWRALVKWCNRLFQIFGNVPCQFPEGTAPQATDNEDRLLKKINKMLE